MEERLERRRSDMLSRSGQPHRRASSVVAIAVAVVAAVLLAPRARLGGPRPHHGPTVTVASLREERSTPRPPEDASSAKG